MTVQLKFFQGNVELLNLQAGIYTLLGEFTPLPAQGEDGEVVSDETSVLVSGASSNDVINNISKIDRVLRLGADMKDDPTRWIYMHWALNENTSIYRTPVFGGGAALNKASTLLARDGKGQADLVIERAGWFESAVEVQIPLSNPLETNNTSGLTIYNPTIHRLANTIAFVAATKKITDSGNGLAVFKTGMTIWVEGSTSNDGAYTIATGGVAGEIVVNETLVNESAGANIGIAGPTCNYVDIAAGDVTGDLSAATRIELINNYNDAGLRVWDLLLSHNVWSDPTNLDQVLQAEAGTGGTLLYSNAASGGRYREVTVPANAAYGTLVSWTLAGADLQRFGSRYVDFVLGLASGSMVATYDDLWLRMAIKMELTTIWTGPLSKVKYGLIELGDVMLPPLYLGSGLPADLTLELQGARTGASTGTLDADWLQLTVLDGYRNFKAFGYGMQYQFKVVDDGIEAVSWLTNGSTRIRPFTDYGERIALVPDRAQRITVLHNYDTRKQPLPYRTLSAKIYARPRRKAL